MQESKLERLRKTAEDLSVTINEWPKGHLEKFAEETQDEALDVIIKMIRILKDEGYSFYIRIYPDPESDTNMLDFVVIPKEKDDNWFENIRRKLYNRLKQEDPQGLAWFVGFDIKV